MAQKPLLLRIIRFGTISANWVLEQQDPATNCIKLCAENLSITGPDAVCTSPETFSVDNLPAGATVSWNGSSLLNITCNNAACSQVTATKTGASGVVDLLATIIPGSGNCGSSIVLTKNVRVGKPDENTFTAYITQGSNTTYMNTYCNKLTSTCSGPVLQGRQPPPPGGIKGPTPQYNSSYYCAGGYIVDPAATSITWSIAQTSFGTFHGFFTSSSNQFSVGINLDFPNEWVVLKCTSTNECGSFSHNYRFYAGNNFCLAPMDHCEIFPDDPGCPIEPRMANPTGNITAGNYIEVYPNPSNGRLTVSLHSENKDAEIREIVVVNKMGLVVKREKFKGAKNYLHLQVDASAPDVYTVRVFDGTQWYSQKVLFIK